MKNKYGATEADLKRTVTEYLDILQNQGKLVWLRLNAGDFIEVRGNTRRRIKGCPAGTADIQVIVKWWPQGAPNKWETRVVFIELKSEKGKQSPEQGAFQKIVEAQGASYFIVRELETLQEILG